MADSEEQDENTPKTLVFDDEFWAEKQRQFNANPRQALFVRLLVENPGLTRTSAARQAGYQGSSIACRVQGSRMWASRKVQALYAAVLADSDLKALDVASRDEVLKWASNQLRAGVGQAQQKSAELLLRFHDGLEGQKRANVPLPDLLTRLYDLGVSVGNPHLIAGAIFWAERDSAGDQACRDWRPSITALRVLRLFAKVTNSLEDRHARYFTTANAGTKKNGGADSRPRGNGASEPQPVTTNQGA